MRGIAPFLALLLANASSWVNAVEVTAETQMTQFSGAGPSWTDTKSNVNIGHPNGLNLHANKYFNWVRKQAGAYTGGGSGENSLLVAVAYNPKTKKLAASTIPRGALRDTMLSAEGKKQAPIWSGAREEQQDRIPLSANKNRVDAEDAAYYILEKNGGVTPASGPKKYGNGQQADSVWISVWGTQHANVPQGPNMAQQLKTLPGSRVNLCSDDSQKQPSCKNLADKLGVYYETVPAPAKNNNNNQPPAKNNNNQPPAKNNNQGPSRPTTPQPGDNKRPASQSPPKSPNKDDKKKKTGAKRRAARRAAIPPVEVEA